MWSRQQAIDVRRELLEDVRGHIHAKLHVQFGRIARRRSIVRVVRVPNRHGRCVAENFGRIIRLPPASVWARRSVRPRDSRPTRVAARPPGTRVTDRISGRRRDPGGGRSEFPWPGRSDGHELGRTTRVGPALRPRGLVDVVVPRGGHHRHGTCVQCARRCDRIQARRTRLTLESCTGCRGWPAPVQRRPRVGRPLPIKRPRRTNQRRSSSQSEGVLKLGGRATETRFEPVIERFTVPRLTTNRSLPGLKIHLKRLWKLRSRDSLSYCRRFCHDTFGVTL